jgi:hypothetical protein
LSQYSVNPLPRARRFDPYRFAILHDGRRVAEIRHDARGEDFQIRTSGEWKPCARIFSGGGRLPLRLTPAGVQFLDRLLGAGASN